MEINKLFEEFPDDSKVWLYQANRALDAEEMDELEKELVNFADEWAAHGNQLAATAKVINPYFSVIVVNDELVPPSGCSVDTKINYIKSIGEKMNVDFFDRMRVTIEKEGEIKQIHFSELKDNKDALIFDSLISDLGNLRKGFPTSIENTNFSHLA